jgi:pimeloyl-ACP methyl ester carboxylesterase
LAGAAWSSLPWLGSLPHHTLLVAGDRDPLVPVLNAEMMRALMRRARVHVIRGGGHLLVVDRATEVAELVAAFLR